MPNPQLYEMIRKDTMTLSFFSLVHCITKKITMLKIIDFAFII